MREAKVISKVMVNGDPRIMVKGHSRVIATHMLS